MAKRYLSKPDDQEVHYIREPATEQYRLDSYKGRVIACKCGVYVQKDGKEIYLSWEELELITAIVRKETTE